MSNALQTPQDEFEEALQKYEVACAEYKLAITRYVRDVGQAQAMLKLEEAMNRICRVDSEFITQEEVELRASRAPARVVNAEVSV